MPAEIILVNSPYSRRLSQPCSKCGAIRLNMVVWYCLFTYNHTFYIHSILFILGVVQRDRERGQWLVQGEQDLVHRDQLGYLALPLVMVELFSLVVQLEEEVQLMLSP